MRLGIDFGTTRTVVAIALDGRYGLASFDVDGEFRDYLPGLLAWCGGELRWGWDALAELEQRPEGVMRSLKRVASLVGPDGIALQVGEQAFTGLDLVVGFLRYLKRMLVERSNLEIEPGEALECFVAVPANANTRQRYLTLEAFRIAGFDVVRMINEPTAAAIEFAYRHQRALSDRSPKRYVLVYDLGGGTFDTSAVSLEGRRFELLASEGINALGGDDFDEVILDLALEQLGITEASLAPHTRHLLLETCREAKEKLSTNSRKVLVDLSNWLPGAQPLVLDAAEVFARCEPLVNRSAQLIQQVVAKLESRGIDPGNLKELGALYLVGGGAAFPAVGKVLRSLYKRKLQLAVQPHAATAIGLAIASDPEAGVFIREASTRLFGVWREGESGSDKVFDQILSKDAVVPDAGAIVVRRRFHPAHNVGHLRFVECTALDAAGQPAGDITPWQELYFPYDPRLASHPELANVPIRRGSDWAHDEIEETYTYRADGVIEASFVNLAHGYAQSCLLEPKHES